jgi:hypothetical protein
MNCSTRTSSISGLVRIALLLACTAALSACVSIPQRAWRNGEGMTSSLAYQAVLSGDMSFRAHRELQQSIDPRRVNFREVAYQPFGDWWWP